MAMDWSQFLGGVGQVAQGAAPLVGTGAAMYGQQNAAEAVSKANNAAIVQQNTTLGNISSMYNPYTSFGANAATQLTNMQGGAGKPADYSNFMNMPGYRFAVEQGTRAAQRQAASMGNAYTPNTAIAIGNQITGTAMQDYNTYIGQLESAAGIGATATGQLGNINYNTGANISQLMSNTGQSQAGMYTGMGQTVAGGLGGYGGYGGFNSSGAGGAGGGPGWGSIGAGIGNIYSGLRGMFRGGSGQPDPNASGSQYDPGTGQSLDYSPYVSTGSAPTGWTDPNAGGITSMDWLNQTQQPPTDWSMGAGGVPGG